VFGFGVQELIIIFLIIMILFGSKKLPGIAKGFGEGIREFKQATKKLEASDDIDSHQIISRR
jgi:TatA/E family protein of Tat protein translocase